MVRNFKISGFPLQTLFAPICNYAVYFNLLLFFLSASFFLLLLFLLSFGFFFFFFVILFSSLFSSSFIPHVPQELPLMISSLMGV